MLWYLSAAMATRLTKMADAEVLEKKDPTLQWKLCIPDDGTAR